MNHRCGTSHYTDQEVSDRNLPIPVTVSDYISFAIEIANMYADATRRAQAAARNAAAPDCKSVIKCQFKYGFIATQPLPVELTIGNGITPTGARYRYYAVKATVEWRAAIFCVRRTLSLPPSVDLISWTEAETTYPFAQAVREEEEQQRKERKKG